MKTSESKCYAYDRVTKEYLGITFGDSSPLEEGVVLYPANTTATPPIVAQKGQAVIWDEATGAWGMETDHRGETWFDGNGNAIAVFDLGDPSGFEPRLYETRPKQDSLSDSTQNSNIMVHDWQFFGLLAIQNVITTDEALNTSSGVLPKLLTDALATISDSNARLVATLKVRSTTNFFRHDSLVAFVAAYITSLGTFGTWDDARLDQFWIDASKLS